MKLPKGWRRVGRREYEHVSGARVVYGGDIWKDGEREITGWSAHRASGIREFFFTTPLSAMAAATGKEG